MENRVCKNCGREIIERNKKAIFCSEKCNRISYSRNRRKRNKNNLEYKQYHRDKSREWYKKNKKRQTQNVLRDYHKNKDKWSIRKAARRNKKAIFDAKGNKCQLCGGTKKLELHHKEYKKIPRNLCNRWHKKERIGFYCSITQLLCFSCHQKVSNENRKF